MSMCIAEVRKKLRETATRLIADIPKIKIGFIAHGDYGDSYVTAKCELTNDVKELVSWINSVRNTSGGGDSMPHPPSYTTEKINWWDELDALIDMDIKVYGVRALEIWSAKYFYEELSDRSGAVSIRFQSFQLIVDMFLAICYRESGKEKLKEFEEEVQSRPTEEGSKVKEEMKQIFSSLAQPNATVKKSQPKIMRCSESWYDISLDLGEPTFTFNDGKWKRVNTRGYVGSILPSEDDVSYEEEDDEGESFSFSKTRNASSDTEEIEERYDEDCSTDVFD